MPEGSQTITQTKTRTKTVIGWALVGGAIVAAAAVAGTRKPNLKIISLVVAPPTPALNASFSVTALVKNAGPKITSDNPFEVRLRIGVSGGGTWDMVPETKTVNGLGLNATATMAWPYIYALPNYGSYMVEVCADKNANDNGVIEEANETDNCKVVSLNLVQPPPADLSVFGIPWIDPGTPITGISVLISASIKNNGSETAPSTIARLRRDLDSNNVWDEGADIDQIVSSLAGGASTLATWNWIAEFPGGATGTRLFQVCADATSVVSEPDEANNCKNFAVYVGPTPTPPPPAFPNLQVQIPASVVGSPIVGSLVNLYSHVKNFGTAEAPATTARLQRDIGNNGAWDPGADLDQPVGALTPNNGTTVTWPNAWEVQAGTHRFQVCADVNNAVIESNEGDNCSISQMIIADPNAPPSPTFPDLRAEIPFMIPGTPTLGNMVDILDYVRNSGTADALASVVRLQRDIGNNGVWDLGADLDMPVGSLASNGGQTVTWSNAWEVQAGIHRFRVCTDVTGIISESNEGNNCSNPLSIYIPGN